MLRRYFFSIFPLFSYVPFVFDSHLCTYVNLQRETEPSRGEAMRIVNENPLELPFQWDALYFGFESIQIENEQHRQFQNGFLAVRKSQCICETGNN